MFELATYRLFPFLAIAALGLALDAPAAPTRVASNAPESMSPRFHGVAGDILFYHPSYGARGQLWRSDGTVAGTFQTGTVATSTGSPSISDFTPIGGSMYFTAADDAHGRELWKTTDAGSPALVKDIVDGPGGSFATGLTTVGGGLYFAAYNDTDKWGVWKSDGTSAGTVMVKGQLPPAGGNLPGGFTRAKRAVVFSAYDGGETESQLWRSDGTPLGTIPLRDASGGTVGYPIGFEAAGELVFFIAYSPGAGNQLWRTDGTAEGTSIVRYIEGGASSGIGSLKVVGNLVFFVARDDAGSELWRSDGTETGTYRVADLCAGPCDSGPHEMTMMAGTLYFIAFDDSRGHEVWRTDGTAVGTRVLKDVAPGAESSLPYQLTAVGNLLFFSANDGTNGQELWVSDGTEAGTRLHSDLTPGPEGSQFAWLAASPRGLFFATRQPGNYPLDLWFDEVVTPICTTGDGDLDGLPDCVENAEGLNPSVKDNDVFGSPRLLAMQLHRDFFNREADAATIDYWATQAAAGLSRTRVTEIFMRSAEFEQAISPLSRLYFAYFLRVPDYGGLNFWLGYHRAGNALAPISDQFAASGEFQAAYGALDNTSFIDRVYRNVLGRAADPGGAEFWTGKLHSGEWSRGQVMTYFSQSPEFTSLTASDVLVTMTYFGMLRRAPDAGGFAYWVDHLDAGGSLQSLLGAILDSAEYRSRFF